MEDASVQVLLKHYDILLELYTKMEGLSQKVSRSFESGSRIGEIMPLLKENAAIADHIRKESETISSMKKSFSDGNLLTEKDRSLIREAEQNLTLAVNRVIEQETKSSDIAKGQGVKISRK
ncbi:hypothetical protein ACFL5B_01895 [Candidatus Latescibacterota bacterium]